MMPPHTNCAVSDISTYIPSAAKPWNSQRAIHLFRRTTFGTSHPKIKNALNQSPKVLVKSIIDQAKTLPTTSAPYWAKWTISNYSPIEQERNTQIANQIIEWISTWVSEMRKNGLRDRMAFFWSNHFVTKFDKYICPSWMYEYHRLLQKHALGNFKDFVREIGLTPAMLVYLDGVQNTKFNPNENYGRELYELFTLGVDNGYTQNDIVETARALTGWNGIDLANLCGDVTFNALLWDNGNKTIFGKTGNWKYNDVIDILFENKAQLIANYICKKIYRHFVNPEVDNTMVAAMANTFVINNFEIAPVLELIFSSEHFFDTATISTVIPGHMELFITYMNELGLANDTSANQLLIYGCDEYDQRVLSPTDVSGWPGNRTWITSASLPFRTEALTQILYFYYIKNGNSLEFLRTFALNLLDASENDPQKVVTTIINYLLPRGLQKQSDYEEALKVFKAEIPENYFSTGQWNLSWEYTPGQLFYLMIHLNSLPEFQLR